MATTIFNNIDNLSFTFTYNPDSNKTVMNILLDTSSRIEGQACHHEEAVLMFKGTPSEFQKKLDDELAHFLGAELGRPSNTEPQ
jgi:hypothetical protein